MASRATTTVAVRAPDPQHRQLPRRPRRGRSSPVARPCRAARGARHAAPLTPGGTGRRSGRPREQHRADRGAERVHRRARCSRSPRAGGGTGRPPTGRAAPHGTSSRGSTAIPSSSGLKDSIAYSGTSTQSVRSSSTARTRCTSSPVGRLGRPQRREVVLALAGEERAVVGIPAVVEDEARGDQAAPSVTTRLTATGLDPALLAHVAEDVSARRHASAISSRRRPNGSSSWDEHSA